MPRLLKMDGISGMRGESLRKPSGGCLTLASTLRLWVALSRCSGAPRLGFRHTDSWSPRWFASGESPKHLDPHHRVAPQHLLLLQVPMLGEAVDNFSLKGDLGAVGVHSPMRPKATRLNPPGTSQSAIVNTVARHRWHDGRG
jgi:hypothetical protein